MATATSRPPAPHFLDPRVSHPLDQLRGTIRRYVVVEGLLSAVVFLAGWFALGLLFDFGLFKVATWDWVLDAPAWVRLVALVITLVLLAAIVALRIVTRLTKDLSYPALALVLERRFPKVLGDRLITAVELADVAHQARYGFSTEMIRQTIEQARERVGTVPVNDVFNWRRLRWMAAVAVGLVVAVVAAGFAAYLGGTGSTDPYRFGWRFAHVTGVFLERNVLLQSTPWPRRAHLELVGLPDDEIRVDKGAPDRVIRAKAYRWVVADRTVPMGWRPMTWADVTEGLVDGPVPALPVKGFQAAAEAGELGDDPNAWTVDQVQAIGLADAEARAKLLGALPGGEYETVRDGLDRVFGALEDKAASPSMGRRLRKLDVPEKVTLVYAGQTKSGDVTLGAQQRNEFAAPVTELKESVQFVVRAEDFRTAPKAITLVPPPMFKTLTRTEFQPAYLHHAPPQGGGYPALAGLRQRMTEQGLSLTGDRSVVAVPSGTELILTATADTDLTAAYLQPKVGILPGAKPGSADKVWVAIGPDKRTVSVEFRGDYRLAAGRTITHYYFDEVGYVAAAEVTTTPTVEFDLIVEQADRVKAQRQILIQVVEDQPPAVELVVETLRKVGSVYYVTPKARIPFNPESYIRDDHGLSKVAFEFTYWAEDSDLGRALRAQLAARPFLSVPGPPAVPGVVVPTFHAVKFKDLDKGDTRRTGSAEVRRFTELQKELQSETSQRLATLLDLPLEEGRAKKIPQTLQFLPDPTDRQKAAGDYFDVKSLKLLANVSEVQTRYRLDLNVVATDTNYDTGPKTGQNAEPIRLLVVSEGDLLAEINKEEDSFATRLDEALSKIAGARKKWEFVRSVNTVGRGTNDRDSLDTVKVRAQDAAQDVGKARDVVQSIVREYRRIYKECVVNDVTEVTRDRFGVFANRIDRVIGENPPPVTREEEGQVRAGIVLPKMTFPVAEKRLEVVLDPLNATQWADPIAVSEAEVALMTLEQEVRAIRAALGELQNSERLKKMLASVIEQQKRIEKELEEWKFKSSDELTKKEPKFLPVGPVFLAKGETKRLKHGINWRQFDKDDLSIRVTVSDKEKKPVPGDVLGVPAELKLNFERNERDFEYDVKAGAKEGEYTITLTPEVGDPVVVTVTIK
ncbi:MAG: hypothetical protein JWO38_6506 [Gemmataceae bacterium]|nr:hypothetical protein [Gemmataceae bacterium]